MAQQRELAAQAQGSPPDPTPEQQPWLTDEDTKGWQTVYRGTGQRRQVRSSVVVELTPEQRAWLDRAGQASGLLRHQLIDKLIEDARLADLDAGMQEHQTSGDERCETSVTSSPSPMA
jgi:hypothetical protein